jgi:hypothetical protein
MWQRFKAQSGMVSPGFNSSRRCFLATSHHLTSFDIASIRKKHEKKPENITNHGEMLSRAAQSEVPQSDSN